MDNSNSPLTKQPQRAVEAGGRSLTNRQMIGVGAGCIPCGKADVAHREESKDVISLSVRFESDVKEVLSRD